MKNSKHSLEEKELVNCFPLLENFTYLSSTSQSFSYISIKTTREHQNKERPLSKPMLQLFQGVTFLHS